MLISKLAELCLMLLYRLTFH